MLKTSDFNFILPSNLIAQEPFFPKEETAMLVYNNKIIDSKIKHLSSFLDAGDVLVFNNTKVIKAQLVGIINRNSSKININLNQKNKDIWNALVKPAKKIKAGDSIEIGEDFFAEVVKKYDDGFIDIKFNCIEENLLSMLDKYGSMPIPPYIKRNKNDDEDQKNYQTFYAKQGQAVAAPTAGLHFSSDLFAELKRKKIKLAFLNLNIGAGTFLPIRSELIKDHKMHLETFSIDEENCRIINEAKEANKKIIAVGTTSLRALESIVKDNQALKATESSTDIFIYPPYNFKIVDALFTNFHLPKSTLFMLVCAFIGTESAFNIYEHAINNRYRFFSYGDCSILFKKN
jgi:S-adenosylmethionine:tRNA ribosyltransferase-isomerase